MITASILIMSLLALTYGYIARDRKKEIFRLYDETVVLNGIVMELKESLRIRRDIIKTKEDIIHTLLKQLEDQEEKYRYPETVIPIVNVSRSIKGISNIPPEIERNKKELKIYFVNNLISKGFIEEQYFIPDEQEDEIILRIVAKKQYKHVSLCSFDPTR